MVVAANRELRGRQDVVVQTADHITIQSSPSALSTNSYPSNCSSDIPPEVLHCVERIDIFEVFLPALGRVALLGIVVPQHPSVLQRVLLTYTHTQENAVSLPPTAR